MISTAKVLVPDKEWLVKDDDHKIGTIAKSKKGYIFLKQGKQIPFKSLAEINAKLGTEIEEENLKKQKISKSEPSSYNIYDFPCSSKPYGPVYNVKKKLPLFAKSDKSKSQYCAGYYVIKFRKGWVKSYCPKLITLERYPFHGPFKTEAEMRNALSQTKE
jgi:hypothetical protein